MPINIYRPDTCIKNPVLTERHDYTGFDHKGNMWAVRCRLLKPASALNRGSREPGDNMHDLKPGWDFWMLDCGTFHASGSLPLRYTPSKVRWVPETLESSGTYIDNWETKPGRIGDGHYEHTEGEFAPISGTPRRARRATTTPCTRRALARWRRRDAKAV